MHILNKFNISLKNKMTEVIISKQVLLKKWNIIYYIYTQTCRLINIHLYII